MLRVVVVRALKQVRVPTLGHKDHSLSLQLSLLEKLLLMQSPLVHMFLLLDFLKHSELLDVGNHIILLRMSDLLLLWLIKAFKFYLRHQVL